jgi:hypothetical protein
MWMKSWRSFLKKGYKMEWAHVPPPIDGGEDVFEDFIGNMEGGVSYAERR